MNESNFRFAYPDHLYALIGVGVCIVVYVLYRFIEKRKVKQLADNDLLSVPIQKHIQSLILNGISYTHEVISVCYVG